MKYHLSAEWLIFGDLKCQLRKVRGCPPRPPTACVAARRWERGMSVIEFPGCETSLEDRSEDEIMQRPFAIWKAGSTTARSSIALQMVEPAIGGREDKHEKAMFAVFE